VVEAIGHPDVRAILITPFNTFLSVDPILAVPKPPSTKLGEAHCRER
jgi:hypothetical protein